LGNWKGTTFTSEEAEINEAGTYLIRDTKNGDQSFECPGLKFSCRKVQLNLEECTYDGSIVNLTFTLTGKGTSPEDILLNFNIYNSSQQRIYGKGVKSSEISDASLHSKNASAYTLKMTLNGLITSVEATYPSCVGQYYVHSVINCAEIKDQHEAIYLTKEESESTPVLQSIKENRVQITPWGRTLSFILNIFTGVKTLR
jgi:hypothetical protein